MVTSRRKLLGSYGVGLAQPRKGREVKICSRGRSSVPMGSMWATGLRVIRPSWSAVSSPSLWAIHAWADSWTERLKRSTT
jgi:hypothetical protein